MKKLYKLLFLIIIMFSFNKVNANTIDNINMDIYIDSNGNANITEVWDASIDTGTEGYHPYFDIGNSTITFNYVKDDLGNNYTFNSNWNINDSFEHKSKTFGIYNTNNEYDLCWGISKYGKRTYTLNYTINNFIYNTTEGYQILYWTLLPEGLSSSVDNVYIKVHSDKTFQNSLPVWGYGNYGGTAYVYNGVIEMTSPSAGLSSGEYITLLVKFDSNTFNTTNSINKSWDNIYKEAQDGANTYKDKNDSSSNNILSTIITILINLFIALVVIIPVGKNYSKAKSSNLNGKEKMKNVLPFRDIPFKDQYQYANFLSQEYGLINTNTNILGAYFLKWIKNNNMTVTTEEKGLFKNKHTKFIINKESASSITNPDELALWNIVNNAAVDNILDDDEFKKYCKNNYTQLLNWFNSTYDNIYNQLKNNSQYITSTEEKKLFGKTTKYTATTKLNEDAKKMAGLKVFFKEFTSLNEKEPIEVKQWREYLIYAQILGIADKVAKDFNKFYPNVISDDYYNDIILINTFSYNSVHAVTEAKNYAEAAERARSYSSGGGGFSSGGGGGGSFGGGGSGGGFR